jgi:hypothetical protein
LGVFICHRLVFREVKGVVKYALYNINFNKNKMRLFLHILLFLWISITLIIAGITVLRAKREVNFYEHLFHWYISPLVIFAGLVFIDRDRKKQYFRRLKSNLFID